MLHREIVGFNRGVNWDCFPKLLYTAWKNGELRIPGCGQDMYIIDLLDAIANIGEDQPDLCLSAIYMDNADSDEFAFVPVYGQEPSVPINALIGCSRIYVYAWSDGYSTPRHPAVRYVFIFEKDALRKKSGKYTQDRDWFNHMRDSIRNDHSICDKFPPVAGGDVTLLGYWA